jgi:predicted N-acetyltransferase YhbS
MGLDTMPAMAEARIRPMTLADVGPAAEAMLLHEFGDRRHQLRFSASYASCRPFVAEADGVIVGTGVATINGPVGWIGTVWVDPAFRRRGLGLGLTQCAIDAAEAAGCRTLVLVATQAGRPMYERIGFTVESWYRIVEAPGLGPEAGSPDSRIRPFRPDDLPAMAALDRVATGEDRADLLGAFSSAASARCLVDESGKLSGFVVRPPWGGAATIAPDIDDAFAILHARRLEHAPGGRVRAGLLSDNVAGLARLAADGWTDAWYAPRLVRGEPFEWDPTSIWGQFNFAIG